MKYFAIRSIWRLLSLPVGVQPRGEETVKAPRALPLRGGKVVRVVFPTFMESLPATWLFTEIAKAYSQVFKEYPWNEEYSIEEAEKILHRDCTEEFFLTVLRSFGDEGPVVGGFLWGAAITTEEIASRIMRARPGANYQDASGIQAKVISILGNGSRVLYMDELAILKEFRGGLAPIQHILRPGLLFGVERGAEASLFWTSWRSNIAPLAICAGWQPVGQMGKIVFLLNRDVTPLLKIAQRLNPESIRRVIGAGSKISGIRKRRKKQ